MRTMISVRRFTVTTCLAGAMALTGCSGGDIAWTHQGTDLAPESAVMPPPISGGGLLVTKTRTIVASDPDRDRIWIQPLDGNAEPRQIVLRPGDEPGRVVEDAAGRVHVALRRGGSVVTIDPSTATLTDRRAVCTSPRGIAYDAAHDALHVACAGGELMTLPAGGGDITRALLLDRDLRDVVVSGDRLLVSRFRAASLIVLDAGGTIVERRTLPAFQATGGAAFGTTGIFSPSVGWRTVGLPNGDALMVHERGLTQPITLAAGGYYSGVPCDGTILHTALSVFQTSTTTKGPSEIVASNGIPNMALPVDVAASPNGSNLAFVAAGTHTVSVVSLNEVQQSVGYTTCTLGYDSERPAMNGQPIAVAFASETEIVVQIREPAQLVVTDASGGITHTFVLPGESRAAAAHTMFHEPPSGTGSVTCASCHPEGHEDGRTWFFTLPDGSITAHRRTQNIGIGGGLLETAPFHWTGDLPDMTHLMSEVFVSRMGGQDPGPRSTAEIGAWLDQLPAIPPTSRSDAAGVARGKALFTSADVGCASCHAGAKLTDNRTIDVGTGGPLQVPALIGVASRAPFMHDGCAATLRARFDDAACGGGEQHGHTAHLSSAQIDDLVGYLESL